MGTQAVTVDTTIARLIGVLAAKHSGFAAREEASMALRGAGSSLQPYLPRLREVLKKEHDPRCIPLLEGTIAAIPVVPAAAPKAQRKSQHSGRGERRKHYLEESVLPKGACPTTITLG